MNRKHTKTSAPDEHLEALGGLLTQPPPRRIAPDMLSPRAKTHNYLNMIVAEQSVKAHDPNAWAVLHDVNGNLAEGIGSNIFIVRDGKLFTRAIATSFRASAARTTGLNVKRSTVQAPGQNGTAEGWIGSCRCEILDHIILLNEAHLRRLIGEYVMYHHEDRIHDALQKDSPNRRPDGD